VNVTRTVPPRVGLATLINFRFLPLCCLWP